MVKSFRTGCTWWCKSINSSFFKTFPILSQNQLDCIIYVKIRMMTTPSLFSRPYYQIDRTTCQEKYYPLEKYPRITEVGSEESHTCEGDSGSPVVDLSSGELVEIVSWGELSTCSSGPDLFTKVFNYFYWIDKNTNHDVTFYNSLWINII